MTLKLEFKDLELKPYVVITQEYSINRRSYVTSIGVTSTYFDKHAVHKSERIYDFYTNQRKYEIVFLENILEHNYFKAMIDELEADKEDFERKYKRTIRHINDFNEAIEL